MMSNKIKQIIFNPIVVLIQSTIPLILIGVSLTLSVIIPGHKGFTELFYILFMIIPFKIGWIYPFFAIIWCVINFIYCIRKKSNKVMASISLTIATFILFIDLFFINIFNLIADLSI